MLTYLAKFGPATKYQIEKALSRDTETRIDHATLHQIVNRLKHNASIKAVRTGKSRVGLPMEYYDLDVARLVGAIQSDATRTLDFNSIANKYRSHLPLIFAKWHMFKKEGLDPVAQLRDTFQSPQVFRWETWMSHDIAALPLGNDLGHYRLLDVDGGGGLIRGVTRGFTKELRYRLAKKPKSKETRRMVATLNKHIQESIYVAFFNIWIGEYVWHQIGPRKQDLLKDHEALSVELDRVIIQDPEIRDWILFVLHDLIEMYSERVQLFERRRKRLRALEDQTRPTTEKTTKPVKAVDQEA